MLLHGPRAGKALVAKRLAGGVGICADEWRRRRPLGSDGVTATLLVARRRRACSFSSTKTLLEKQSETHGAHAQRAERVPVPGQPTTSFVLVLATNRAEDLDEACWIKR